MSTDEVVRITDSEVEAYETVLTLRIAARFEDEFTRKLNKLIKDFNEQIEEEASRPMHEDQGIDEFFEREI